MNTLTKYNVPFSKSKAVEAITAAKLTYDYTYVLDQYICLAVLPSNLGFVLQKNKTTEILIALRGSQEFEDFIQDAKVMLIQTPFGSIHKGFYEDFQLLMPAIAHSLQQLQMHEHYKITVTGHSLGAALAPIIAYVLKLLAHDDKWHFSFDVQVYVAALPKVSDESFTENYSLMEIPTWAFCNIHDVVTQIPEGFGYVPLVDYIDVEFQHHCIVKNHSIDNYLHLITGFKS